MAVIEYAPAKINLGLKITGKRSDGYHNILSVFQTVDLCDELHVDALQNKRLSCSNPYLSDGPDNLVLRAEDYVCKRFGVKERLHFNLIKRIPVEGGLGGGSSDAAAAFRGVIRYHGLDIEELILAEMASELGSDIPFLLDGGTSVVSGRGEIIRRVEWPFDFTYVLVYPGFGVSTSWAYRNLGSIGQDSGSYNSAAEKLLEGGISREEFLVSLSNDFEPVVFNRYPALKEIKRALLDNGAEAALLSGSGSTVIGIFNNEKDALKFAGLTHDDDYKIFVVRNY